MRTHVLPSVLEAVSIAFDVGTSYLCNSNHCYQCVRASDEMMYPSKILAMNKVNKSEPIGSIMSLFTDFFVKSDQ